MAFIIAEDGQIIIDAVLTKRGRELLASGVSQFNVTKFAVADDEIDYSIIGLQNTLNNSPQEYPILQPVINGNMMMKSFLFTDPNSGNGRYVLPLISISGLATGTSNIVNGGSSITYTPATLNMAQTYQIKINGGKYALKQLFEQINGSVSPSGTKGSMSTLDTASALSNQSFVTLKTIRVATAKTFSITITGQQSGASITYSFTISPSSSGFSESGTGVVSAS